jgi:hypothetical protein
MIRGISQDTTQTITPVPVKQPVEIFSSEKVINATTPETVGKGRMAFKVTHNFGDIAGKNGGIKQFFGLDNTTDVRIAFEIGLGKKFDLILGRSKGYVIPKQWEMGFKWKLAEQYENGSPFAIAFAFSNVISTHTKSTVPNQETSFDDFGDRISNAYQLIFARKMGAVSLQLNSILVTRGYAISYDQKTIFALGGAIRFPLMKDRLNMLIDYFHPFHNQSSKDSFLLKQNVSFYDPLGIGFEILTPGHIFRLNFTNAAEIQDHRFVARTAHSWGKGMFRWGFTISRNFVLWRDKEVK